MYESNPVNTLNGNFQRIINDAIDSFLKEIALENYTNPKYWVDGNKYVDPLYVPSFSDLMAQVNAGSSATIHFDSSTADSNISSSWAQSDKSSGFLFWGTTESSVSESVNEKASSSKITVEITLDKYAYLAVRAGSWFTPGFFTDQYHNPSKWTGGQTAWDKVFGTSGSCQYIANQTLLLNGYKIVVTTHASYSQSDYSEVSTSKGTNVWPFYCSPNGSVTTQSFKHNSDESITVTLTCNPGSLQIFGMGVLTTAAAVGSGSVSRLI